MRPLLIGALVLALIVAGSMVYLRSRTAPVDKPAEPAAAPAAVRRTEPPPSPAAEPAPAPAVEAAPRKAAPKKPAPAPAPAAAPAAPTFASLTLSSDVAGASVFINRQYAGTTPLTLDRLEPGPRQFKLTADGFDSIERSVDLAAGDNPVTLRFKEVRLHTRIAVSHKHVTGSCDGTLVATLDGLAYETSNKNDAITLAWDQVETMAVDYLDKNLKVKQKGGKTWNFTDKKAANADALFVFQRDVEAARKKLSSGYTAVR